MTFKQACSTCGTDDHECRVEGGKCCDVCQHGDLAVDLLVDRPSGGPPDWTQTAHEELLPVQLADFDRCVHGRHSIDPCVGCPGGWSTGNLFLAVYHTTNPGYLGFEGTEVVRDAEVVIGTTLRGRPIVVVPVRSVPGRDR